MLKIDYIPELDDPVFDFPAIEQLPRIRLSYFLGDNLYKINNNSGLRSSEVLRMAAKLLKDNKIVHYIRPPGMINAGIYFTNEQDVSMAAIILLQLPTMNK